MNATLVSGQKYRIILNPELFLHHLDVMNGLPLLFDDSDDVEVMLHSGIYLVLDRHDLFVLLCLAAPQARSQTRLVVETCDSCTQRNVYQLQFIFISSLKDRVLTSKLVKKTQGSKNRPKASIPTVNNSANLKQYSFNTTQG